MMVSKSLLLLKYLKTVRAFYHCLLQSSNQT